MTGSTPPWKRRFRKGADEGPHDGSHGVRDDERGSSDPGAASLERTDGAASGGAHGTHGQEAQPGLPVPAASSAPEPVPGRRRRAAVVRNGLRQGLKAGARAGGSRARAGLAYLADRLIETAPRIPVRDLATLRRQFPGLGPEELADKLVAGAAGGTSAVGAGIGAAAMLPVPPAMPTELATEITGVAAIELKMIAELYEVYGQRPPGTLRQRSSAYLSSWAGERGIDVTRPATINDALGGQMKRQLRQQIMKRMVRNLPNLTPFLVGAAVGAVMNRRDTKHLAERIRKDLRTRQVPWEALRDLPPLEEPADALDVGEPPKGLGRGGGFRAASE
ncbi:hypothetical protein [Streptomyces poonensis]|uniref:EcsC family protein n=1 Tax=Streptomyces poonensis TaxID=68255 RepID=A0A918Q9Q1_9ACTN|nr:hypothetical protein [Streptomyces poonensis]GGZ36889.1 hypothetical protein GCM10010365_67150 [Streptomyces poonensis]GLJ90116.1 hypothetical protein GCM10017589_27170 [Streptomyces poonensis]